MAERSFRFTHAIARRPGASISAGLRANSGADPDAARFLAQHDAYVSALESAGVEVTVLPALDAFPDSVFVEDAAFCLDDVAIALRPGAPSRFGEAAAIRPALEDAFSVVIDLPGDGFVDGGDLLLTESELLVGLSSRTDVAGFEALASVLADAGCPARRVDTPAGVLHFKSDCGMLDAETIYATPRLAASGCFDGYRIIETPRGEESSANLVRVNDAVLLSHGHPRAQRLLRDSGYDVVVLDTTEAACVDGGLSCMSLRFSRDGLEETKASR